MKLGGTAHTLTKKEMQMDSKMRKEVEVVVEDAWYGAQSFTMIVGADVTHSGKGIDSTVPSVAGVVATVDARSGKYLASARLQQHNTEAKPKAFSVSSSS